jgi:hypothetical protein
MGAVSTLKTVLKYGATADAVTKLCAIKDYPDLGGEPEMLETTTLDDDIQTFIPGIQQLSAMVFTANYDDTEFDTIKADERKAGYYALEFGDAGADGKFTWQGQHVVYATGGSVNGVREMKIAIAPSTKVTKATA